jgi:hypothetical protein
MNDMKKAFRSRVELKFYCRSADPSVIGSAHFGCASRPSLHSYSLFPQRERSFTAVNAFLGAGN